MTRDQTLAITGLVGGGIVLAWIWARRGMSVDPVTVQTPSVPEQVGSAGGGAGIPDISFTFPDTTLPSLVAPGTGSSVAIAPDGYGVSNPQYQTGPSLLQQIAARMDANGCGCANSVPNYGSPSAPDFVGVVPASPLPQLGPTPQAPTFVQQVKNVVGYLLPGFGPTGTGGNFIGSITGGGAVNQENPFDQVVTNGPWQDWVRQITPIIARAGG